MCICMLLLRRGAVSCYAVVDDSVSFSMIMFDGFLFDHLYRYLLSRLGVNVVGSS